MNTGWRRPVCQSVDVIALNCDIGRSTWINDVHDSEPINGPGDVTASDRVIMTLYPICQVVEHTRSERRILNHEILANQRPTCDQAGRDGGIDEVPQIFDRRIVTFAARTVTLPKISLSSITVPALVITCSPYNGFSTVPTGTPECVRSGL